MYGTETPEDGWAFTDRCGQTVRKVAVTKQVTLDISASCFSSETTQALRFSYNSGRRGASVMRKDFLPPRWDGDPESKLP